MEDGKILGQLMVNDQPIKPKPIEYGHILTLTGIGAGIPTYELEHVVRVDAYRDPDNWTCVSYPGLTDAISDEIAPILKEVADFTAKNGEAVEPFADFETAAKTPQLGLLMISTMFGNASEFEMWVDLGL